MTPVAARQWDLQLSGRAGIFSRGIWRIPHLRQFLEAEALVLRPRSPSEIDYVVGWGHRPTVKEARRFAEEHGLPFVRLEDGFLRSTYPGRTQPPASMVIDPDGIYYDSQTPSRLERIIDGGISNPELLARARNARRRIVAEGISKYNHAPLDADVVLSQLPSEYVLVIDQVGKDTSVQLGADGGRVFPRMLESARQENPGMPLVVKGHPAARHPREGALRGAGSEVRWVRDLVNPHALIARASKVYTATSQVGFEALLHQKPVVCFGAPFYAGWGLTDDRTHLLRRGVERGLDELVAAALLLYSRYVQPVTGERCALEDVLTHFELQKTAFEQNRGRVYCFGFWWWKRQHARQFLRAPGNEPIFCWGAADARRRGFGSGVRALTWGQRDDARTRDLCQQYGVALERMEDGFIRSVGLGSDLTAPWSLVVDRRGIYYDPSTPSELERILMTRDFSEEELQRAAALRELVLSQRISKYNGSARSSRVLDDAPPGRRRVLVPGQVEQDASVRLGSPVIRTNLELLRRVREENPDAHIIFKPHPDVEAGNRPGRVPDDEALTYCDQIVRDVSIVDCLGRVEEVHTLTSLVGFEALLRELRVVVYGQPFYAGWGLTVDRLPVARRGRQLSLNELVAGSLLLYPRYVDPRSGYFCTAEQAVLSLVRQRTEPNRSQTLLRLPLGRPMMRTLNFVRGFVREAHRV